MVKRTKGLKTVFICTNCGYESLKWLGRCSQCGEWDSLVEQQDEKEGDSISCGLFKTIQPLPLPDAPDGDEERICTGIGELDRVLGGGIVPGSVTLIGGDPGIGKSTLILQLMAAVAAGNRSVLYVSGEESSRQIKLRARRLGALHQQVFLACSGRVEDILDMARKYQPALLAVDSIQTLTCEAFPSAPGSVTQVRESAARLLALAKECNLPTILVGHVTKEGALAGPKVLEHMVDTVLYFEGDRNHAFRLLRTVKNRFGATNEIGVFEMKGEGLEQVTNPSEIFLAERPLDASGSVVLPSMEGTRPILVEVQALVSPTTLGTARRTAIGSDPQRLSLLCAVLEKKAGLDLYGHDIFLNIAGGIRVDEPALDLGVVGALSSSFLERPIPSATVLCGEVGLAGEVRGVSQLELRINEAARLGFSRFILPQSNLTRRSFSTHMELVGVTSVEELLEVVFG